MYDTVTGYSLWALPHAKWDCLNHQDGRACPTCFWHFGALGPQQGPPCCHAHSLSTVVQQTGPQSWGYDKDLGMHLCRQATKADHFYIPFTSLTAWFPQKICFKLTLDDGTKTIWFQGIDLREILALICPLDQFVELHLPGFFGRATGLPADLWTFGGWDCIWNTLPLVSFTWLPYRLQFRAAQGCLNSIQHWRFSLKAWCGWGHAWVYDVGFLVNWCLVVGCGVDSCVYWGSASNIIRRDTCLTAASGESLRGVSQSQCRSAS